MVLCGGGCGSNSLWRVIRQQATVHPGPHCTVDIAGTPTLHEHVLLFEFDTEQRKSKTIFCFDKISLIPSI